jgi:putative cell wall-binding protein
MKKFKKSLALLTVMAMVLTLFAGVAGAATTKVEVYVDGTLKEFGKEFANVKDFFEDEDKFKGEKVVIEFNEGDYDGFTIPAALDAAKEVTVVAVDGADDTTIEGKVVIEAENVVFDDFTVEGQNGGIGITVNAENVTVKNCVVTDFETGIEVNADKALIENNEILDNLENGIVANMDDDWTIRIRDNYIENEEGSSYCIYIAVGKSEDVVANISGNEFVQVDDEVAIGTDGSDDDDYRNYVDINLRNNVFESDDDDDVEIERLAGDNRYETAVEISKEGWNHSDVVVLARGDDFADALAGTVLAAVEDAPILLTQTDELPDVVADEIERLWADEVFILGGEEAISDDVVEALEELGIDNITRLAGDDRFETAVAIAEEIDDDFKFEQAVIVNGLDFPDALAAGPLAAALEAPILLTFDDELADATADVLEDEFDDLEEVFVIGGRAVVSADVYEELLDDYDVERLYGDDRFETAVDVAEWMLKDKNQEDYEFEAPEYLYVANGLGFADALAGGALAARENGVIILTLEERNPDCVVEFIEDNNFDEEEDIFFLGGKAVLAEDLFSDFSSTADFKDVEYGEGSYKIGDEEEVEDFAELEEALTDKDVGTIVLEKSITVPSDEDGNSILTIAKAGLTIDGNGMTLHGSLTIDEDADDVTVEDLIITKNLEVNGDNFTSKDNHIIGNVIVDGTNAEFNTEIDGDVTVEEGASATFTNVTIGGNLNVASGASVVLAGKTVVEGTVKGGGDITFPDGPKADFEFNKNEEGEYEVTVKNVANIADDVPLRYLMKVVEGSLDGVSVSYGEGEGTFTITDDEAFFGPPTGFTLEALSALKTEEGVTTTFWFTDEEPDSGTYSFTVSIVDVSDNNEVLVTSEVFKFKIESDDEIEGGDGE